MFLNLLQGRNPVEGDTVLVRRLSGNPSDLGLPYFLDSSGLDTNQVVNFSLTHDLRGYLQAAPAPALPATRATQSGPVLQSR